MGSYSYPLPEAAPLQAARTSKTSSLVRRGGRSQSGRPFSLRGHPATQPSESHAPNRTTNLRDQIPESNEFLDPNWHPNGVRL